MQDNKRFNDEITKPLEKYTKEIMFKKHNLNTLKKENKKKRVAFLIERAIFHSINQVMYSFFKALQEDERFKKFEFYILNYDLVELVGGDESIEKYFKNIGFKYINLHKSFGCEKNALYNQVQKAIKTREYIIDEDIDILVNIGNLHAIYTFLFASRTAPKQIYWSHGNCEYDIDDIDLRVSHFIQDCTDKKFEIIPVKIDKIFLIGTEDEKKAGFGLKQQMLKKYGEDTVVLGTIGRLVKIDNDKYISTVAKIMEQNPNTIYLACGPGNRQSIEKKLDKYQIDKERWIFTGEINSNIYGWIINICLDTFPTPQGQSAAEIKAKGGVVIRLEK